MNAPRVSVAVIVCCQLMLVVDSTIVNIALPDIKADLGFSATGLAWVPAAYTLAFAGLLLIGGKAGDRFGRRRALMAGVAVFTVASLAAGFALSPAWLISARIAQGIGAALAGPSTLSLIAVSFPDEQDRNRALGAFSTVAGLGLTVGLVAGGILTTGISWRAVFFVNVPFGVAILMLAPIFIRETPAHPAPLGITGAISGALAVAALTFGFLRAASMGWADAPAIVAFICAGALVFVFVVLQVRGSNPIIPLQLVMQRNRAASLANMFLLATSLTGIVYFLSQFLQLVRGLDPLIAGLAFLPMAITQIAAANLAPRLLRQYSAKTVTISGTVLIVVAFSWLSRLTFETGYFEAVLGPLLLFGVGIGLCFMPLNKIIVEGVPSRDLGAVSGMLQTMQRIGGSAGLAILVTVFATATSTMTRLAGTEEAVAGARDMARGIAAAFSAGAIFSLVALVIASIVFVQPSRPS